MATAKDVAEKIRRLLEGDLHWEVADLDVTPSGAVFGAVVASQFDGMPDIERQSLLWSHLRKHLNAEEQREIAAIMALTPAEQRLYGDE